MDRLKKYMLIRGYDGVVQVWEYIDDLEEAMSYWYVKQAIEKYGVESMMPIVMNKHGGYHTHRPDDEDVIDIIESVGWPKLKLWQQYPKNSQDFRTGWVSPTGDTYKCAVYEHIDCAMAIAEQLYGEHTKTICDDFLLKAGWFKVANKKYIGYRSRMSDTQAKLFLDKNFVNEADSDGFDIKNGVF